jgi:thymidylate kinase
MKPPKLICFMGIDGSGKTTLARELVREADRLGIHYRYVWGNAQPIFLRPLRALAHLTVLRKTDMKKDNEDYEQVKEKVSIKYGFFSRIYSRVLMVDYFIWLFLKVKIPLFLGRRILCDRYLFDVAINLYFLNKSLFPEIERTVHSLLRYFPAPDLLFLIDIPPAVAFERKSDIPSIGFLEKRRAIYHKLSEDFNAVVLDGTSPIVDSVNVVLKYMTGVK